MAIRKSKPTKTQQILELPLTLLGGVIEGCEFVGKRLRRHRAEGLIRGEDAAPLRKSSTGLQEELSDTVQVANDIFTVTTTTRFMLVHTTPHSVVIPFRLSGRLTTERGFLVEYTTDDMTVLQEWHYLLCEKVRSGKYKVMLEQAHTGLFPLEEDELDLAPYVRGFRCP